MDTYFHSSFISVTSGYELAEHIKEAFSFKPVDIIEARGLKNPIFSNSMNYGNFEKSELPWEKPDEKKLDKLTS